MRPFSEGYPYSAGAAEFAVLPADHIDAVILSAGTSYRHPIPTGAQYVIFSLNGDIWVRFGDSVVTAAVPSVSVTTGGAAELNPTQRRIPVGATHIALISEAACKGSLAFYE